MYEILRLKEKQASGWNGITHKMNEVTFMTYRGPLGIIHFNIYCNFWFWVLFRKARFSITYNAAWLLVQIIAILCFIDELLFEGRGINSEQYFSEEIILCNQKIKGSQPGNICTNRNLLHRSGNLVDLNYLIGVDLGVCLIICIGGLGIWQILVQTNDRSGRSTWWNLPCTAFSPISQDIQLGRVPSCPECGG